jgi:hypothetical protein
MKGDFSRETFDAYHHYAGVLFQQGRVQVDADFNEQHAISNYTSRSLARDLIGPHGGPAENLGFACITNKNEFSRWHSCQPGVRTAEFESIVQDVDWTRDFLIMPGRYYVDGIFLENHTIVRFCEGADASAVESLASAQEPLAIYLEAFERVVTPAEDPRLLDRALEGIDTSLRLGVQWQVGLHACDGRTLPRQLPLLTRSRYGLMTARTNLPNEGGSTSRGGYTGTENRLYRVEIHTGAEAGTPSFKWSRDNGARVRSIRQLVAQDSNQLRLDLLPCLGKPPFPIVVGDYVELLPEFDPGPYFRGPLLRVAAASSDFNSLTVDTPITVVDTKRVGLLRLWDQRGGAILIPSDGTPVELEDGIEVMFDAETRSDLRTGDYWTIPARPSIADIDWPRVGTSSNLGQPLSRPASGPWSASAPLGVLRRADGGIGWTFIDARRAFASLARSEDD